MGAGDNVRGYPWCGRPARWQVHGRRTSVRLPSPPFYRYLLTIGPTNAPFAPQLRTAAHANVPSRSDPTSHHPARQNSTANDLSPTLPCMTATPMPNAVLASTPRRQHLHLPQRRRTTSPRALPLFPTAPTLGHAHLSCHCPLLPTFPSPAHKHEHSRPRVFVWHAS